MLQSKPESEKPPMTYIRKKRSREARPTVSYSPPGCEADTVKHSPSVSQVADAPLTHQKVKIISRAENVTVAACQHQSEMRSKMRSERIDVCENVEEIGFCKAQNNQECLNHPRTRSQRKRESEKVAIEISDSENSAGANSDGFSEGENGFSEGEKCNNAITQLGRKLDDQTFQYYLENMWRNFSEDKKNSFTHLDSLWYTIYSNESAQERVMKWIKKKDIFSKKYVFVPIVHWSHWSLLIFCHFDESLESKSKTRTPCMLLLDSLQKTGPKRLEPGIRKFVLDIYRTHERAVNEKLLYKMPLLVPKVPQQINGQECGFYVLFYINLFVEGAPENFSCSNGYPYFMKQDWFTPEGFSCFCRTLDSSSDEDLLAGDSF